MVQGPILVVDDAPDVAFILRHVGRRVGWEVVTRPDVEKARTWLRTERPVLAVVDVHLPGASGYEFCRGVRAEPGLADLPVALFSHWARPEDVVTALDAGADFVLSKELLGRPNECRQRLEEILGWTAGRPALPPLPWKDAPATVDDLQQRVRRAGREVLIGQIGPEVLEALVQRACRQQKDTRLATLALQEEFWRVLGTAGSASLWQALGATGSGTPTEAIVR